MNRTAYKVAIYVLYSCLVLGLLWLTGCAPPRAKVPQAEVKVNFTPEQAEPTTAQQAKLDEAARPHQRAAILVKAGHYAEAKARYRRALAIQERTWGETNPDVAMTLSGLATLLISQQKDREAMSLYERARRILLTIARNNADLDDTTLRLLEQPGDTILRAYLTLLIHVAQRQSDTNPDAALQAFTVAEQMCGGKVQAALNRAAARTLAADPATAALAQQMHRLFNRHRTVRETLTVLSGTPVAERDMSHMATNPAAAGNESHRCNREQVLAPTLPTPMLGHHFPLSERVLCINGATFDDIYPRVGQPQLTDGKLVNVLT